MDSLLLFDLVVLEVLDPREEQGVCRAPKKDRGEPWWKTQDIRQEGDPGSASASGRGVLQVNQRTNGTCTRNDHQDREGTVIVME